MREPPPEAKNSIKYLPKDTHVNYEAPKATAELGSESNSRADTLYTPQLQRRPRRLDLKTTLLI